MFGNSSGSDAGQKLFLSSIYGLATTLAWVSAFLGGPWLWLHTNTFVRDMTYQTYGPDLVGLASLAWYGLCYLIVFFVSRATIGTAIVTCGLAVATRFL